MDLNSIVNLAISKETASVSQAGFGTALILGAHKVFNERVKLYTSASAMLTDGFDSTDAEYIAASKLMSQTPTPTSFMVGRRTVDNAGVSVDTVVLNTDYTVTINGVDFTFNSGGAPTALTIATGLHTAINAGAEPVTSTDDGDGTISLAADVAGVAWSLAVVGVNLSIEKPYTVADTVANDLAAVKIENDDWYALILHSHVQADVEAAAAWIETEYKIYGTSGSDVNIYSSGSTTDVAATLKGLNYENTFGKFHPNPETFPEAGWLGKQLPTLPGESTWKFKTIAGIAVTSLTSTQSSVIDGKNFNTYESVGGVAITGEGVMASGEKIDVTRTIHWTSARVKEEVFGLMASSKKIPFTDGGVAAIKAKIQGVLNQGVANGAFASDPAPFVTVPKVANISAANKAARTLPDIKFQAVIAGAVHNVVIAGVVSL